MDNKERFCKFSIEGEDEDIHAIIRGMSLTEIARAVGASLNSYSSDTIKDSTYKEKKEEVLNLCHEFCDAMQINTQDLNPWNPVTKIPYSNRKWPLLILLANDFGERMSIGYYDDEEHVYRYSDGMVFEDAAWWKEIQDVPQS